MFPIDVRVREISNAGNLIASTTAVIVTEVGDIKISRINVVKGKDEKPFISLPQQQYKNNEGETQYKTIIELPYRIMREIEEKVFKELGL